jgi:hypothetical protein
LTIEKGATSLDEQFWSQDFPITSVTRADLVAAGIPRAVVKQLTDDDMRHIASKMEDLYCDHGYWDDIHTALEKVKGEGYGKKPMRQDGEA